jgi:threonine aldolase
MAARHRTLAKAADAEARDGQAMAVVVQTAQGFAGGLAEAIEAVGPGGGVRREHRCPRREPDRVVAARIDDPRYPVGDSGLEHAMSQADVAVDGRRQVGLGRDRSKVHHGIAAVHEASEHVSIASDVGDHDAVARRHDVDAAHVVAGGGEPVHQTPTDPPRRPGDHHAHRVMVARAEPRRTPRHTWRVQLPDPPARSFASDNAAGAHPAIIEAIARANEGHALAYGDDDRTRECEARFRDLFGAPVETLLVFNGTGANVLALATMLGPAQSVVCSDWAHIAVDETGAPERVLGAKLQDLPCRDGKLQPAQLAELEHFLGVEHHAQPGVLSITQSTELGTLYSPAEVAALCEQAHRMGMTVHLDGARIANASAALGDDVTALRAFTIDAGVDVVTFGGTKNGLLGGEAVVYLNPSLARHAKYVRKQVTQLPSKMRFVAAQFNALLDDGLWLQLAAHSNAMATRLCSLASDIPGVEISRRPAVNSIFARLPAGAIEPLRQWCFFWDWDVSRNEVRWMTAWDTTEDDVERFAAGVREILATCN